VTALSLIVACSRDGVIGRDGDLPWHLPSDLKRFKALTEGHAVIMGRRTWESLPERFRPLPGRRNLVLTRRPDYEAPGAEVFGSLSAAVAAVAGSGFVIGGGQVYDEALPLARRAYVTHVDTDVEGDTFFPDLVPAEWSLAAEDGPHEENGLPFSFRTYERR
jgi:dihydrofolate reductase